MSSSTRNEKWKERFEQIKYPEKQPEKKNLNKSSIIWFAFFGLLMFFVFTNRYNLININELLVSRNKSDIKIASATVYYYDTKDITEQSKVGEMNRTIGYVVKYRYKVNGLTYNQEEVLNTWVKPSFIIFLNEHLNQEVFTVRYEILNPKKASLVQQVKE